MTTKTTAMILSFLILTAGALQSSAGASQEEERIRDNYKTITSGYQQRNPQMAMSPYIKDESLTVFDVVAPFEDHGYQRSLDKTRNFMDSTIGPMVIDYSHIKVVVSRDYAFTTYTVHIVAQGKQGQNIDVTARGTHVLKKVGGQWLVIIEHNSTPQNWKMDL